MAVHVYPINDLAPHEVDDTEGSCECQPTVKYVNTKTGLPYSEPIIVHNSFDLREMFEEDGPWS